MPLNIDSSQVSERGRACIWNNTMEMAICNLAFLFSTLNFRIMDFHYLISKFNGTLDAILFWDYSKKHRKIKYCMMMNTNFVRREHYFYVAFIIFFFPVLTCKNSHIFITIRDPTIQKVHFRLHTNIIISNVAFFFRSNYRYGRLTRKKRSIRHNGLNN